MDIMSILFIGMFIIFGLFILLDVLLRRGFGDKEKI